MSLRSTYFDESFSWYKTKLQVLGLPSKVLHYQDFQILDIRLKEFCCTFICRFQVGDHRVKMVGSISQLWCVPDLFVYVILICYCHF